MQGLRTLCPLGGDTPPSFRYRSANAAAEVVESSHPAFAGRGLRLRSKRWMRQVSLRARWGREWCWREFGGSSLGKNRSTALLHGSSWWVIFYPVVRVISYPLV